MMNDDANDWCWWQWMMNGRRWWWMMINDDNDDIDDDGWLIIEVDDNADLWWKNNESWYACIIRYENKKNIQIQTQAGVPNILSLKQILTNCGTLVIILM